MGSIDRFRSWRDAERERAERTARGQREADRQNEERVAARSARQREARRSSIVHRPGAPGYDASRSDSTRLGMVREDWLTDRANAWMRWPAPQNAIAGEENYQSDIRRLSAPRGGRALRLVNVALEPEKDNPVDSDAVCARVAGVRVGYLRSELARSAALAGPITVPGVIRGGGTDRDGRQVPLGVHIWTGGAVSGVPALPDDCGFGVRWPPGEIELSRLQRGPRLA